MNKRRRFKAKRRRRAAKREQLVRWDASFAAWADAYVTRFTVTTDLDVVDACMSKLAVAKNVS